MAGVTHPDELSDRDASVDDTVDVPANAMALALVGAAIVAISMFLPFAEPPESVSRIEQNTLIQHAESWALLGFAVAIGATAYRAYTRRRRTWAPLALGVWALAVAIYLGTSEDILTVCPESLLQRCERASPGVGIYGAGVGGVLAIIGGWQIWSSKPAALAGDETRGIGQADPERTKKCPDCAELVQPDARVCKHCGCRFDGGPT